MFKFLSKALGVAGYVIQYGCITHCAFEYIGDFVICNGPSMEPTLYSNNVLVTERITPRLSSVHRGDIIIAKCPTNPTQYICKRVIGIPGDRILSVEPAINNLLKVEEYKIDKNKDQQVESFVVNSAIVDSSTAKRSEKSSDKLPVLGSLDSFKKTKLVEIIVPRGHVWIEGDNSENSADSRFYGPIPQGLIKSRAICRLWPINDIKMLI